MADTSLLVSKITFVVTEITVKVAVIISSVVKNTFVVAEITFKVVVITSSVVKISFLKNGSRECKSNNKHLYHIKLT